MEQNKRSTKRNRHTGGKVTAGAVILALLLAGGHFGLGIGREGGGLLTGQALETATETVTETAQKAEEKAAEVVETVQEKVEEVVSPQDDGVLTVTVREDKLLYEGQEVTLVQLEEALLRDYSDGVKVSLTDDHAIKAAYDEAKALLQKLNIPFTEGK